MVELGYRTFGRSGLRVADVCLGTMNFGLPDWGTDKATTRAIYETYRAAGGNFLDTANQYGSGASESMIADLVSGHREEIVIASKYTNSYATTDPNASGNQRKNLVQSLDATLRRLKTDYVDLYYLHAWDGMTPIDEVVRALDDAVRAGKVLYVGISNAPAWVISYANAIAYLRGWSPFVGLEVAYNLLERDPERDLLPMARALGIGVVAWAPLKAGILTGKYLDGADSRGARFTTPRFQSPEVQWLRDIGPNGERVVREVVAVSQELEVSPAQVALAWMMRREDRVIPIVGATRVEQLEDNLAAAALELGPEHMQRLEAVSQVPRGYPHDYLATDMARSFFSGGLIDRITSHNRL